MSLDADVLTIFPHMFPGPLGDSITGRALAQGLARVNALLRRTNVYAGESAGEAFVTGDLRVDFDQHLAYKAGRPLDLTPTEFNILAFLARSPGEVQASRAILQKVWNFEPAIAKEAVNNMIGPKMWSLGEFNRTELDRTVDGLKLIGEVKGDIDWSKLIDQSYLPKDLQGKL